ncbi:hypothetical protein TRFO_20671 [Tritrichomonas foetus]|uniref:Protein kinase domain-containing protein n=1 Tax=Tritrichomonas foetus TaxID=1144522 RepID=A0A1J4KL86_9EUKA|nr:hypothetical protein TRFO_20671 [Tritrichomonas foetus]|eukprot:OHT10133.1 hypothetical protein TRFO_20671 [Tritrichomonas foetus]
MKCISVNDFLNNFDFQNIIGRGFYGVVCKAIDKNTQEEVAIQFFNSVRLEFHDFREFVARNSLGIPGVVPILHFYDNISKQQNESISIQVGSKKVNLNDSDHITVTKFIKNRNLEIVLVDYLSGRPTPGFGPTERSKIIFGIAKIMELAYEKKDFFHGELFTRKVLLDENFEPQISDFAIVLLQQRWNHYGLTNQSYAEFIAPETFDSDRIYIKQPVDVYAFGTLLYRMFTHNRELDDRKRSYTINRFLYRVYKGARFLKQDSIPEHYWELIQMCWDHDPQRRPDFKSIVLHLKDEKFALEEKGMKTNMQSLKEYQERLCNSR